MTVLSNLRFARDAALRLWLPAAREDISAVRAARGFAGELEGVGYRGIAVLSAVRPVRGFDWHLVAEIGCCEGVRACVTSCLGAREEGRTRSWQP